MNSNAVAKLAAAMFYGFASVAIMFANKYTLTTHKFPSSVFLTLVQFVATVVALRVGKAAGWISFPDWSNALARKLFPLPIFVLLNVLCGLAGTKLVNIAMFTVLRRFSIPMTLMLNYFILDRGSTMLTKVSVVTMVLGAVIAAGADLSFNLVGVLYILGNDVFTALQGVILEKKLDARELNKWGLMYYNSLIALPFVFLAFLAQTEKAAAVVQFPAWNSWSFISCFTMSAVMGVVLQYSIFVCTQINSALTTSVVGCLKNVLTAYLSILGAGGDYIFSMTNFVGINVSIAGSLLYAYVEFQKRNEKKQITIPREATTSPKATTV